MDARTKLDADSLVLLEEPLVRLPYELSRNVFKTVQRNIEQNDAKVNELISQAIKATSSPASDPSQSLDALDQSIKRLTALRKKLSTCNDAQAKLINQSRTRINHLGELYDMQTFSDVKYERWSKVRTDRMIVDYMARRGYMKSARAMANSTNIDGLVDLDEAEAAAKIENSLRLGHSVDLALTWCGENKQALKKMGCSLEYQLRLQQCIELMRLGTIPGLRKAADHAQKYLIANQAVVTEASGLLAFAYERKGDNSQEPEYVRKLFSPDRWHVLADDFLKAHHEILGIPTKPTLYFALTAGLSALKTPQCHHEISSALDASWEHNGVGMSPNSHASPLYSPTSPMAPSEDADIDMTDTVEGAADPRASRSIDEVLKEPPKSIFTEPMCPICSPELNRLAAEVPFALHSKSNLEDDAVVLPTGRLYGRKTLEKWNEIMGINDGRVRDPKDMTTPYKWDQVRKVFVL